MVIHAVAALPRRVDQAARCGAFIITSHLCEGSIQVKVTAPRTPLFAADNFLRVAQRILMGS